MNCLEQPMIRAFFELIFIILLIKKKLQEENFVLKNFDFKQL